MFSVSIISIILVLILVLIYFNSIEITVPNSPFIWTVSGYYNNSKEAAILMANANNRIIRLLAFLKQKYSIDSIKGARPITTDKGALIAYHILIGYNPETIVENDPVLGSGTSYTIDKGRKMYLCCRSKKNPNVLTDINTLMFVLLHEIAHIGNYNGWGHNEDFWVVFKFILKQATAIGIYTPENYEKEPKYYCGMDIVYQPLYDSSLGDI